MQTKNIQFGNNCLQLFFNILCTLQRCLKHIAVHGRKTITNLNDAYT